jgi:hypothetical protein
MAGPPGERRSIVYGRDAATLPGARFLIGLGPFLSVSSSEGVLRNAKYCAVLDADGGMVRGLPHSPSGLDVARPIRKVALCNDWDRVIDALRHGDDLTLEVELNEIHVWAGDPRPGDRCQCGSRTWT